MFVNRIITQRSTLIIVVLIITVWLAFAPCLESGFVNWDDTSHLTENAQVRLHSYHNIIEIFRRPVNRTYIPLTILSFQFEHTLFGLDPFIYHFNNVLLHSLNTVLVFVLALQLGIPFWGAFLGALIFAVHPMHVESVAWVTQRKDVLYSFFYLLTLLSYLMYVRKQQWLWFFFSLGFGLLSILAKPMALTLPWILLLFDWWCGRSILQCRVWLEKTPFLLLIEPIAWITYSLNSRFVPFQFPESIFVFIWTMTFYLKKFFWPISLAIVYRVPEPISLANLNYILAVLILFGSLIACYRFRKLRLLIFAFIFYCGSTFFLWRFDTWDLNIVADRFMYLPSLGFCMLLGYGAYRILQRMKTVRWKYFCSFSGIGVVFILFFLKTFTQCSMWSDGKLLWAAALKLAPNNPLLLTNLGDHHAKNGDFDTALIFYDLAVATKIDYAEVYDKRGVIYDEAKGKPDLAIVQFDLALQYDPSYAKAYYHKANTFMQIERNDLALELYSKAIMYNPYLAEAYINRGHLYMKIHKDYDAALNDLNRSIELDPGFVESYINRGVIWGWIKGKAQEGLADFNRAIELEPTSTQAHLQRARLYRNMGDLDAAINGYDILLQNEPKHAAAIEERRELYELISK